METRWTARDRSAHIAAAKGRTFDLVIIGGGITGAGVAREAALRGLTFCLVDKNDFAFGTSSRSSKLCHGGLRYLSQGKLGLVRESTTERNWLRHVLPHLVRPLGFMYCTYEHGKDNALAIRGALHLYDALSDAFSDHKTNRRAEFFTPAAVAEIEPEITQRDPDLGAMTMGGLYYDTNVDDGRLTLETIKESLELGGDRSVAVNYARVAGTLKDCRGRVTGVRVEDVLSGRGADGDSPRQGGDDGFEVTGRAVVSCTGIWSDQVMALTDLAQEKIYPTKGVHVVVPNERLGNRNAFGIRSFDDGRFYFVLRRGPVSVIGTTDTDYYKESRDLDEPRCTQADCDYLLRSVNRLFPRAQLTYRDVISTYAGIRPLIREPGSKNESAVSREHAIYASPDGVVAIAGGKMTTYRRMGEDLLFYLTRHHHLPPFASSRHRERGLSKVPFRVGVTREEFARVVAARGLAGVCAAEQLDHLHQQYGRQAIAILAAIRKRPRAGAPLLDGHPYCEAEIEFILEHENAPRLIDVLGRRTEAQWLIWHHQQPRLAEQVAAVMARYYRWPAKRREQEIADYLGTVRRAVSFV
jgi:glycerol-3-phosphate dehydrogenase